MNNNHKGFTLVELMIVVAIIGILAIVAVPAYEKHTRKVNRSAAKDALVSFSIAMEKVMLEKQDYRLANGGDSPAAKNNEPPVPALFPSEAPLDAPTKHYNLTFTATTSDTFTVRATPKGGSPMNGDGFLELDSTGRKAWDRNNNSQVEVPDELCWKVINNKC